ncbi:MAG: ATP-binding protein [Candidatus Cloacimonetes bacterium]|nr:ATP-binding protein [Candidatus Cloacimonadota bacterium]
MTDDLLRRAQLLGLYGMVANWSEMRTHDLVRRVIELEEAERQRRSLERRLKRSKVGAFKPMADFDWGWPSKIDRQQIESVLALDFRADNANVILVGPNGVGKTTIARNVAHEALRAGMTVLSVKASELVADLAVQDTSVALQRRLRRYVNPALLVIDELGYLSHDDRQGDLLFEVVSKRHERAPIVLTTNKPFAEWNEVFPNSSCVTALVDRLVHRAEIVVIEGQSYRAKEAKERASRQASARRAPAADRKPRPRREERG